MSPTTSRTASACRRPASVSGRSVTLVCRPLALHSVSPCRTIHSAACSGRSGTTKAGPSAGPASTELTRTLLCAVCSGGLLGLPEDLVDLGDVVEQRLRLGRVDRTLAAGRAGLLGGLVEQLVQLRVLLEVVGLEVVGPQHPEVVLDQIGPLLLDDEGAGTEHRILVLLVLLADRLHRLGLDAGLRGVVDTAGQVAVCECDGGRAEQAHIV